MFIKSKDYGGYIHTQKINLGEEFGKEDEEVFVVLRELDTKSVLKLKDASAKQSEDETALLDVFREILPTLIVDHNFYESEDKKMTAGEVTDLFFEKLSTVGKVLNSLQKVNFFH